MSTPLLVILGPTASGKSALAMALARRLGAEILSVDSMQVYRGMDIGTAKPSADERAEVPHHLIDVVNPNEEFTTARFVELADAVIEQRARTRDGAASISLIATGGAPLYYKALFQGMFEGPSANPALRAKRGALPNQELHARLSRLDAAAAGRIHVNDTRRLIRALEVHELTGQPISSLQTEWASAGHRHDAVWIGLSWERDALNRRINARVRQMLSDGWLEEARLLLGRYSTLSKTAGEATGYAELIAHLERRLSLDDAAERIKIATRQLARRQMKWFRRFAGVRWLEGDQPLETLLSQSLNVIEGSRTSEPHRTMSDEQDKPTAR